jgi:hypothetical protein
MVTPIPNNKTLNSVINFRLSSVEKQVLRYVAETHDVSMTDIMRDALNHVIARLDTEDLTPNVQHAISDLKQEREIRQIFQIRKDAHRLAQCQEWITRIERAKTERKKGLVPPVPPKYRILYTMTDAMINQLHDLELNVMVILSNKIQLYEDERKRQETTQ